MQNSMYGMPSTHTIQKFNKQKQKTKKKKTNKQKYKQNKNQRTPKMHKYQTN
jgi:hypothetical protein